MICLITLIMIGCQSTNYFNTDVSGVKLDAFGKRGNYIDSVDNRINDRIIDNYLEDFKEEGQWEEEVRNMDAGLQELMTAISSAIAGVYCLVKVIINIVKKVKK